VVVVVQAFNLFKSSVKNNAEHSGGGGKISLRPLGHMSGNGRVMKKNYSVCIVHACS
jgi:hypothetical protein